MRTVKIYGSRKTVGEDGPSSSLLCLCVYVKIKEKPTWNIWFPPDTLLELPSPNVFLFIRVHTFRWVWEKAFIDHNVFSAFLVEFGTLVQWQFVAVIIGQGVQPLADEVRQNPRLRHYNHWGTRVLKPQRSHTTSLLLVKKILKYFHLCTPSCLGTLC